MQTNQAFHRSHAYVNYLEEIAMHFHRAMIDYELDVQNFFYKISSIQGKLRLSKLLHVYKLYIISTGNLHEKEFSHMYLQRSDERSDKERQYCYGFLRGFFYQ